MERSTYENTLDQYSGCLDDVIGLIPQYEEKEEEIRIIEANKQLFEFVKREALYKTLSAVTLNETSPQILVLGSDPESGSKCSSLVSVRINFTKKKIGFPQRKVDPCGRVYFDYGIIPGIINLNLNHKTGELCFITGGVPFSRSLPMERYLALQNYVLQKLKHYFESKEPDIEDLFIFSENELLTMSEQALSDEHRQDEIESFGEAQADVLPNCNEFHWSQQIPFVFQKQTGVAVQEVVERRETALPKHLRVAMLKRVGGANAEEVLAALRRMIGQETKIEGSHHFFRSERTRLVLPVPHHSRKDRHHISLRLLLNNLSRWGYSLMEFSAELGVKIGVE